MTRGWALCAAVVTLAAAPGVHLDVPLFEQAPERCGPASLAMVLGYWGADSSALRETERTYDPALRGALITDLKECARRLGYEARVGQPGEDSLAWFLGQGVPPIVLVHRGWGPIARGHYAVVVAFDPASARFTLHDGGARPRQVSTAALHSAWRSAGGLALIVSPRAP